MLASCSLLVELHSEAQTSGSCADFVLDKLRLGRGTGIGLVFRNESRQTPKRV